MKEIILLLVCLDYTNHCQELNMPSRIVAYAPNEMPECTTEANRINDAGGSAMCYIMKSHEGIEWVR